MREEHLHIDYDLVVKYLTGEADASERARVERWAGKSEENRKELERIGSIWRRAGGYEATEPAPVDPLQAWEKLQKRIKAEKETRQVHFEPAGRHSRGFVFYFTRAAAAAALIVAAVYIFRSPAPQTTIALQAENEVLTDTLPDGTAVALNESSRLTFAEEGSVRSASLSGEAFFEVKAAPEKPFVIETEAAIVSVVGTSFNLQDYPNADTVILAMQTGKAWLKNKAGADSLAASAGETAYLDKKTGALGYLTRDPSNEAYWLTKTLIFKKTTLSQVFAMLEQTYFVTIEVDNPEILNCRLSAKYKDTPPADILNQIAAVFNLEVNLIDGRYRIHGDGCE